MTFWEIFWGAVPLAIMFGAGVFMGVTITSMAAAGKAEPERKKKGKERRKTKMDDKSSKDLMDAEVQKALAEAAKTAKEIKSDFKGCWGCEFCDKINPEENRCEKTGRIFEDRFECSEQRLKDCPLNEGGKENESNGDCDNDSDMCNAAGIGTDQQMEEVKPLIDERTEWECEA